MLFSNANNDPSAELGTKELQKLRRQDLLEFLLDQMVENDTLRDTLAALLYGGEAQGKA